MKNIAVTQDRLKRAVAQGVLASTGHSMDTVITETRDNLSVQTAEVKKIFAGINRYELKLNDGKTVEAHYNYPIVSKDMIISFLPAGEELEDDKTGETYVKPDKRLYCNVLQYNKDSTSLDYLVLGFVASESDTIADECYEGDLILQNGANKIIITRDEIMFNCDNFIVNGVSFKKTKLNNYYTKKEIDKMLEELKPV